VIWEAGAPPSAVWIASVPPKHVIPVSRGLHGLKPIMWESATGRATSPRCSPCGATNTARQRSSERAGRLEGR
jgi:hypothetical protein